MAVRFLTVSFESHQVGGHDTIWEAIAWARQVREPCAICAVAKTELSDKEEPIVLGREFFAHFGLAEGIQFHPTYQPTA